MTPIIVNTIVRIIKKQVSTFIFVVAQGTIDRNEAISYYLVFQFSTFISKPSDNIIAIYILG